MYNLFRHWARNFRLSDPTFLNWVFETASYLSIGLFWEKRFSETNTIFNRFRTLSKEFSCFCPKTFDVVVKTALHLSKETFWWKRIFFQKKKVFLIILRYWVKFFWLSVENLWRYFKPQFYVSLGTFCGKIVFFWKNRSFLIFFGSRAKLFMPFVGIISLGLSNLHWINRGILLTERIPTKSVPNHLMTFNKIFPTFRPKFFNGISQTAFYLSIKSVWWKTDFFERKTNPLNFQILSETFAAFSPKLSEIEHKIFSFLSEKNGPDRRNCSSSVKRCFFE